MLIQLLTCELLKLKRSQVLLMTMLCPLAVVLLQMLISIDNGGKAIEEKGWSMYWHGTISLWYMFVLPLYAALITTLINGLEHKYAGWRIMAMFPVKQWQLFLVKGLVAWLLIGLATIVMYLFANFSIFALTLIGIENSDKFVSPFLTHLSRVFIAILPVIAIGHLFSWLSKNLIAPIAIGVIMTMTALKAVHSPTYWIYDPWTYHLTTTLVSDPSVQQQAMLTGGLLGGAVLLLGAYWVNRREIYC